MTWYLVWRSGAVCAFLAAIASLFGAGIMGDHRLKRLRLDLPVPGSRSHRQRLPAGRARMVGSTPVSDPAVEAAQRAWHAQGVWRNLLASQPCPSPREIAAAREALTPIRELHRPARFEACDTGPFCPVCDIGWPCATAKLIYTSEELT